MSFFRRILKALTGMPGPVVIATGSIFTSSRGNARASPGPRVHRYNDLSQSEEDDGYFCRKIITVAGCPWQATLELKFDRNRRITEQWVQGGELVSAEEYAAQEAASAEQP